MPSTTNFLKLLLNLIVKSQILLHFSVDAFTVFHATSDSSTLRITELDLVERRRH